MTQPTKQFNQLSKMPPREFEKALAKEMYPTFATPLKDIKGEEIESVLRQVQANYSCFMALRKDFRRQEMYSGETCYCLDFSEIYPYLHPLQRPALFPERDIENSVISKLVLEAPTPRMTLPIATLYELLEHLQYLRNELRTRGTLISERWLSFLGSGELDRFKTEIERYQGDSTFLIDWFSRARVDKWPSLKAISLDADFASKLSQVLGRLEWLLTERITPLHDLVSPSELDISHDAFGESLRFLVRHRPRPEQALRNRIDALNFALTFYLNESSYEKYRSEGKVFHYFILLTRGWSSALANPVFSVDPIREETDLTRSGIVRDVQYALYRRLVESLFSDSNKRELFAIAAVQDCFVKETLLTQMKMSGKAVFSDADVEGFLGKRPATALESRLFRDQPDQLYEFTSRYNQILRDAELFDEAKSFFESSAGSRDLVDALVASDSLLEFPAEYTELERKLRGTEQNIRAEYTKLERKLRELMQKVDESLEALQVSVAKYYPLRMEAAAAKFSIEVEKDTDGHKSILVNILPSKETLCRLELSEASFTVTCNAWPGRLNWFWRLANYLVRTATEQDNEEGLRFRKTEKPFVNVISMKEESWQENSLVPLYDWKPDELWAKASAGWEGVPKFVRINAPYMEIWYDFLRPDFKTAEVGLISHLPLAHQAAYLVARAQPRLVSTDALEKTLNEVLSKKYALYEVEPKLKYWLRDRAKSYQVDLSDETSQHLLEMSIDSFDRIHEMLTKKAEETAKNLGLEDSSNTYVALVEEWARRVEENE